MKYIPITFNGKVVEYNGLKLIEISEDIIENHDNIGFRIGLSLMEYYLKKPYRNESESIIVLIDINKSMMNKNNLEKINEIGLPLINIDNRDYIMPVLTKVNKKKITALDDLKMIIDSNVNNTLQFKIQNSSKKVKFIIKGNDIETIKFN